MADGEGICWREWLASRITTGRVIRGGFSLVGVAALGWDGVWTAARRGGWVGGWLARRGAAWRGMAWVRARAAHTVALDEKCSQRATAAGKFTRITRAKLNGEG